MLSGHGGVVIGSEMSGDVKKVTISNCVFDGTDRGIRIKTTRGRGGVVEDIRVDNIVMKNIRDQAIVLDMEYSKTKPEPVSERTPKFRNIRFSNITAYTKKAMYINGLDEMPVSEISLHDVVFEAETGIVIRNAQDIELRHVRVNTKMGPAVSAEKSSRILIDALSTAKPLMDAPLIRLTDVKEALLTNHWLFDGSHKFAEIKGAATSNILLHNNILKGATVTTAADVPTGTVQL